MALSRLRHLRPNPAKLGVIPLRPGEASRPVRVRASLEVFERLSLMTAAQIGALLEIALRDRDSAALRDAPPQGFTRDEANALIGRRVLMLNDGGGVYRKGSRARVIGLQRVVSGEGYEIYLDSDAIVSRAGFGRMCELIEIPAGSDP